MTMETLGIAVTYRPDAQVRENLEKMAEQVDFLCVIDNESSEASRNLLHFEDPKKIAFILNEKNEGVAKALNQGIRFGIENGARFFVLFDQDSSPKSGMIKALRETCEDRGPLSLCGPILEDRSTGVLDIHRSSPDAFPVELLITSGSFFSKNVVEKIGLMDEALFIDYVDHDFCLRLAGTGGSIYRVPKARLLHTFGSATKKQFLGRQFFVQSYSPLRRYFMARNRVVIYFRYPQMSKPWFRNDILFALKDSLKMLFFENDRFVKLKNIFWGCRDGLNMVRRRKGP